MERFSSVVYFYGRITKLTNYPSTVISTAPSWFFVIFLIEHYHTYFMQSYIKKKPSETLAELRFHGLCTNCSAPFITRLKTNITTNVCMCAM